MAINKNEGLEDLKKNGWVPFSKQKYEIKDDAGNTVGTIGYKAAKALNNNKLFDYDPSNDEEKKVFSYLRQRHNRESRKREQREYYASIPYRKIDEISQSTDLSKSEKEKRIDETVEKYSRSGQKRENLKKYAEEKKPDSFVSWLGKNAMSGLSQFNKQTISTLDYILPTEFLGKYDFISKANDYYKKESERYADEAQKSSVSRGKGWTTGGELVSGTVNALPNAIMAFMSAGASLGASAAPTLTNTAATSSSMLSKIGQSAKEMVQNPSYWTSVLQTLGTDYEDAKERGANDFTAAATAILTTALNAGIEVGGGTEVLPKKLKEGSKNAVLDWVKSSLEEGGEEIVQGITTNAMAKLMYDRNAPIFSTTDENAVVNPVNLSKEFGMGAAVGGILGGGQIGAAQGINKVINYADNQTIGKRALSVSQPDVLINRAIDAGLESSDEKTVGRIQKLADKYKSGNASAAEVGEIIKTGLRTGYEQAQNLKVTEDTQTNDDVALPTQDNARQSVLAAANSGNSESSVISPSVTAAANVSERQMHDVKENLSEGGAAQSVEQVQNAVKKVTNTMINEFKNSNIKNIPNYQAAYDENLRLSTTKGATIDKDFIKTYANQYAEGLKRNNSKAYKALASVSDDVGSMLTDYLISNRIPQGIGDISALAQAGGELRSIVGKAAQTTLAMNGKIYNDTDRVSAISNEISNGNFAVVDGANDGNIALAKVGEYYEAYGADAVALAKAFGVSTHYIQKNGRKTLVAAVPSKYIGEYATKSGYSGTQYSAGGNEYIYLTKDAERGNLSADAVRSDITAESDSDFITEIEKNGMIELDERPSESKIETIAAQVERDNTIPVYLDGVDNLGEVLLVYANEEDVTRNMVKTDINSYYDGVMPERGIPLSENTDRHYDEDTIEISERPSEYDADSYALVVELDRTIPILLNGVDELGEVELNYSNEENVTRDMVKSDIDAYYSGTMPERGVSLSNNYDTDIKFSVDRDGYSHVYNVEKADKGYLDYSNSDIETAIENIRNGNADKIPSEIEVARLNSQTVKKISDVVGFDISDYKCKIEKDTLLHIEKRHGLDGKQDQSLAAPKDVARMGYVINNADNVSFLKDGNGDRVVSKKYNDRNNTPCPILMISKRIDGTYCVSQVVPDSKKKTVWVTSARIQKADVGSQVPNTVKGQQLTSETPLVSSSALDNINISQNDDVVKSSIRKNSGNDTDIKFSVDRDGYSKQLVTDFETAAKDIMTISDYSARVNAEARTAVRILENTPNVILDNIEGSANLPIVINFTKMYLAARKSGVIKGNYHNLGSDILMKLPQMISDPDMILQLGNGRLNLLSETKTENGNNAVVSIELNSTKDIEGKNKNYNVVVTLFSANDNYVRNLINKDGTEIKYTKEDLSQVNPRLYNRPATFNDKSSIDNISQNDDVVNSNIRKNSENDTDIKFSVESVDGTDKKYVKADRQVISGDNPEEWRKQVYNYINSSIRKGKDINVLSADGDVLTITEDTAGKARFRNTIREPNGNMRKMTNEEFAVKLRAESHIDEIAEVSKKNGYSAIDTKNHHFAKDGFYYRTAYFEDFDGKYYKLTLSVGKSGEINTVYNVGKLKETYGRARDSKVVEQKPNNARRGFSDEAVPFKTASETNIGLRGGTPSDNTNISQNDDIVNSNIRENSENDTENVKFSQDNSLDGGGIIRYNDDIDIPYRESQQLREYIMAENNRNGSKLKPSGCKEIGDNFYVWRNNSKTDYDVVMQIEIDGNEDVIDLIRKGFENGETYGINKGTTELAEIVDSVRSDRGRNDRNNALNTTELSDGNDGGLYNRQLSDKDGFGFSFESGRNQQNTEVENYGRDDILDGNDRRTLGESERERGSSVREITGNAKGNAGEEQSSASSRRIYARDVKEAGGVERRNDRGVEADFVKSEYYNDEMRRIAAENDERGVVTHFILGNGRAIKYGTDFRGAVRGDEVYIQADHGKYSPTQINRHEITHRNYSTDTVQALKNRIKSRLTNEQINDIAESLYRDYAQKRRSFDEIFEEFVCDVMADMNDYAEMFSAETREYWAAEEQDRKGYSPSTYTESIDAGGEVNEYKNTETLGKNEAYRSNDSVWTQSDDTGEVYRRLEGNRTSSSVRLEKRSGFVDWSRNIQPNSTDYTRAKKRAYGILREISKKRIADVDTEGRTLSHGIKEYFSDTVFKNERGELIPLFHSTDNEFNTFKYGDFGFHLGSAEQAVSIGAKYIKEVYVNIKNPFYAMDMGKWPALVVADEARRQGVISQSEYDAISKMDGFYGWEYDSRANASLRNLLKARGYDGIIYNNRFEGDGISAIAFDSNQIKYVSNQNPTQSSDIRFSTDENTDVNVSDDEDMSYLSEPVKNIRNDINEVINRADLKKGGKVYDRAAAVRVRDSILDNISIGDIQGIDMRTKKDRAVMTVLVNRALNSAGVDAKRKSARDLTRYIAQNASVYDADSLCADSGVDYEGDRAVILNYIKHGVKISPDAREAIISAVGENSAKGYIAMMSNNSALGIDSVYDELSVALPGYFTSDALTEGEKMRRVIDVYTWLKDGKSMQDVKLIDVMTPDDARAFTELVQKQLELAFDTMGRDSAISREIAAERTKYEQRLSDIREKYEAKIADMRSSAKKKQSDGAKAKNISTEQTGNRFKNLAEAAKKYGAIAKGANAVRDIEIPKRIDDNRYVSRFARTMAEAGVTPDESLSEFERDILDGKMTYERITDEEAKKSATDKIMRRGFMQALDDWNEMIRSNQRIGKNEMALGQTLYNQCINAKDAQNAMKIAADLANIATQAGQTVQACTLIKQMSPDCQLYSLEQSVEKMKNEFENKRKFVSGEKRKIDLKINEELAQKLLNAKTEDERRAVMDEILQDIANQIPSTLKDKWDSWRYLSMLGNPRTHIRNIGGNAVFMLPVKVKNAVGWVLEKSISKDKRTKSLKSTKDSKNFAAADYIKMKDIIQGSSGKYEELSKINELRRIYKFKPLEALRKANFAALEWEDGIFLKQHYVNAMSQFLTARGYTSEFMNSGTKEAATAFENARAYAMNEAQKATYRDANAIAETLSRWQRNLQNNDKLGVRVVGQAVEGIVPFKKTPLNIAKRGVEYSPIGLINGLYDAAANIKSGKVTAAQAIDKIASGLTGTGLVILGMGLSKLGLVKGDDDDDDKLARLDSATGEQSYSFKIGNHSYTIDWVAPASMPFFMGVSMQNAFDKTDKFTFEETLNAVLKIPAPLLNLSVLSSLNDLIRAGDYSSTPTEKMADYAWQATTSYVGQAFPTVMGQIARTVDKTKRNASFTDPDNGLPAGLDRFIARQTTKIPGLSKILEPKIDMWGREETYGDTWYGRLIGNTISPGYYKEINSTVLDDELRRLGNEYEGDGSVLPPKAPKYFTYEKQKYYMTPSEYARYSVIRGQKSFEAADELIRTDDYKNKSAAEKKKALEKCYDAAGDEAKNEILKGRGIDVAAKEAEKAAAKKKTKKKSSKKKK